MFLNGMIPKNSSRKVIPKSLADPILTAILEDDCGRLAELVSNLDDVNAAFHLYNKKLPDILSNNPTMLCLCCFFGSIECFDLLRNFDASIKEEDDFGRTCIHFATAGGSLDMMRILDQSITDNVKENNNNDNNNGNSNDDNTNNDNNNNNDNQNDDSSSDDTPIFIGRGIFRRRFFLNNFLNMDTKNVYNKCDDRGLTPMHYAAMFGRLDVIRYLWTKGAQLDKIHDYQGNRPIHLACLYGHTDVVKFFVNNGVKFESNKISNKLQPIHYACIGGYIDTIEYLISLKADINLMANSKTPIFYAARYGSLGAVKLLVKHGATFKFKRRKNSPIVEAALGGHADVINYFLQNGCDPNVYTSTGETPLMAAITGNNAEVVKLLIKNGAKIDFEPKKRKKSKTSKNEEEQNTAQSSDDEIEAKPKTRSQKDRKERSDRRKKMAMLDKEILDINNYNSRETSDLLIASSRHGNIEIFKLILENIDIQKYIESDIEIANRKKKVNKEMYSLILEEERQEEIQRKRRIKLRLAHRRTFLDSDESSDPDVNDSESDDKKKKETDKTGEEESESEEEDLKDEDDKIFHKLCMHGYYSYGSYEDANLFSDPNCGKLYQLFSNAVDFKSLELLKILVENKLVPKDTNKFYIRAANEGCIEMLDYMLDNDLPFKKNDVSLKKEIFNLGKIEILEKFRQKGLKFDKQNDVCFLSRIISSYNPELLSYVLDNILIEDKSKPPKKASKKVTQIRRFPSDFYPYDFSLGYLENIPSNDPVNIILTKALQFPIAPNHSIIKRNMANFEKTISENEENLKKMLNILLDHGFKFNPKGAMFTVQHCVSMKSINLLFSLMKEIENRPNSEKMDFEKLKLGQIIHLLEEYDISEYIEFIDFLFARNFSPKPKETEIKQQQMRLLEEVDTTFSSALRSISTKSRESDRISAIRRLSNMGLITDSSDEEYFYDKEYAESENDVPESERETKEKERKEREEKEKEKIVQRQINLINYMLSHGTPILERSLRMIEKIGHKADNMDIINLAFKNLVLIDQSYKYERRYHIIDNDEHKTPLELACKRGYYDIAIDLIKRGANINESGFNEFSSPLMFAMISKNEKLVNFLKSMKAKMPLNNPTGSPKLLRSKNWMPKNGFFFYYPNLRRWRMGYGSNDDDDDSNDSESSSDDSDVTLLDKPTSPTPPAAPAPAQAVAAPMQPNQGNNVNANLNLQMQNAASFALPNIGKNLPQMIQPVPPMMKLNASMMSNNMHIQNAMQVPPQNANMMSNIMQVPPQNANAMSNNMQVQNVNMMNNKLPVQNAVQVPPQNANAMSNNMQVQNANMMNNNMQVQNVNMMNNKLPVQNAVQVPQPNASAMNTQTANQASQSSSNSNLQSAQSANSGSVSQSASSGGLNNGTNVPAAQPMPYASTHPAAIYAPMNGQCIGPAPFLLQQMGAVSPAAMNSQLMYGGAFNGQMKNAANYFYMNGLHPPASSNFPNAYAASNISQFTQKNNAPPKK